ncbi:MAG: 30S ribosomal protein S8 [Nanoarchaeota archaeon]
MSQDIVADALNLIINAKKAKKENVEVKKYSKLLLAVLAIAKLKGYIKSYKVNNYSLSIDIGPVSGCKAIKPRYVVSNEEIGKYIARYLPARNIGIIIISTNQGLMTHHTAQGKKLGGSLIAYFY